MNFTYNYSQKKQYNVLIFDSGLGGLSIYKKMQHRFPNINYIYVFDNECFPYGNKEISFIFERCSKIIELVSKKIHISTMILACNTISVTSLMSLKKTFNFPIIGITPDIKKSIKITRTKTIGLLATKVTIHHDSIQKKIASLLPEIIIKTLYNNNLVKLAEKKIKYNFVNKKEISNIMKPWYSKTNNVDTIILGCTHFNFLKYEIQQLFSKKICILNSNIKISKKFFNILKNNYIKKNKNIVFFSKFEKNHIYILNLFKTYKFSKFKKLNI
ncbi:MAG: glutamate racemase [Buchnera aphidicola (Nurudea shiraii)]